MKKNKKLSDVEWEALYERSLINAKYMKNKQETLTIDWIPFKLSSLDNKLWVATDLCPKGM